MTAAICLDKARSGGKIVRCRSCVMPACVPGSDFDDSGQCMWCRTGFPNYRPAGEEALRERLEAYRGENGAADCMVAISGGKDSCYSLLYVVRDLGLRAEAFTYVHDGSAEFSVENARKVCRELGVQHHIVALPNHKHLRIFKAFLNAWLANERPLASTMMCVACKHMFLLGSQLAQRRGIPNVVWADCPLEVPPFIPAQPRGQATTASRGTMTMGSLLAKELILHPRFSAAFLRHCGTCMKGCLAFRATTGYLRRRFPRVNHVGFFHYVPWDEERVRRELCEATDWSLPSNVGMDWHSDCLMTPFKLYMFQRMLGGSYTDAYISNRIRYGEISREQGLTMLAASHQYVPEALLAALSQLGLEHLTDRFDLSCFQT